MFGNSTRKQVMIPNKKHFNEAFLTMGQNFSYEVVKKISNNYSQRSHLSLALCLYQRPYKREKGMDNHFNYILEYTKKQGFIYSLILYSVLYFSHTLYNSFTI